MRILELELDGLYEALDDADREAMADWCMRAMKLQGWS